MSALRVVNYTMRAPWLLTIAFHSPTIAEIAGLPDCFPLLHHYSRCLESEPVAYMQRKLLRMKNRWDASTEVL
ncbi:hypothetical protein F4823DRAFT_609952 [Ustulina deusta]|nr:hypothetical protein F4823DRAFT_609952 [Ustulina deusta]